jgi:hypothetical protein
MLSQVSFFPFYHVLKNLSELKVGEREATSSTDVLCMGRTFGEQGGKEK